MSRLDAYRARWLTPPEDDPPEPCPHCGRSDREECPCPRELAYPEDQPEDGDAADLRREDRESAERHREEMQDKADRLPPR